MFELSSFCVSEYAKAMAFGNVFLSQPVKHVALVMYIVFVHKDEVRSD